MSDSGSWERVGAAKTGKAKNGINGAKTKDGDKAKKAANAPRLEDVLSPEQLSAAYALHTFDAKENVPPKAEPKAVKKGQENNDAKKKPAATSNNEKKREDKPKTVDEAAKKVVVSDLKSQITSSKVSFADNQLMWLRNTAAFMNSALNAEDSVDLQDAFSEKPLSCLTKETKKTLTALLEECTDSSRQVGFETFLATMAHELSKGLPVNGYLVFLQLLAEVYPSLCASNMTRYGELRASYQNRPNITMAMLWALGQGGRKDLSNGLKVWLDFMCPLLTMKNYSRSVVQYLSTLLSRHESKLSAASSGKQPRVLYPAHFLRFLDVIYMTAYGSVGKDLEADLLKQYPKIKAISIGNCSADHELFPEFLRRLQTLHPAASTSSSAPPAPPKHNPQMKAELLRCLLACLENNKAATKHWQQMYTSYIPASADLLAFIDSDFSRVSRTLGRDAAFRELLVLFAEHNASLSVNKDGVVAATKACNALLRKMSSSARSRSWFPWKSASLLLVIAIATVVNNDIKKHGSFKKSRTGLFLSDVGLYDHTVVAADFTVRTYTDVRVWSEKNLPVYYKETVTFVEPYRKKSMELAGDAWVWTKKTSYAAADKANEYWPGVREKAVMVAEETGKLLSSFFKWAVEIIGVYGRKAVQAGSDFYQHVSSGKFEWSDVSHFAQVSWEWTSRTAVDTYHYCQRQVQVLMK